jgi:hypothetical protein
VFLYIPIILIYSYALYVLICAKQILKKGIPVTFLHRVRTLDTSKNMLTIFSLYYACAVCLAILTSTVKYFWPALSFTFSTKALLSLVVLWMMENSEFEQTSSLSQSQGRDPSVRLPTAAAYLARADQYETDETVDQASILYNLNHALQHEVVTYATVGIQQCATTHSPPEAGGPAGGPASSGSNHSHHDLRQSLFSSSRNPAFPRTLTNTTNHSQFHPWNEYCSLQILIPQDLFVIDNDHFQTLARGSMKDLHRALKTSSQTMTVPALKSILQTKFLHHEHDHSAAAAAEEDRCYLGSGSDSEVLSRMDGHRKTITPTATIDRPNSWNLSLLQRGARSEEKTNTGAFGKLTDDLIDQATERSLSSSEAEGSGGEDVTILPLNKNNLLSQMRLHVRSITRPASETIPRRDQSFFLSIKDCLGSPLPSFCFPPPSPHPILQVALLGTFEDICGFISPLCLCLTLPLPPSQDLSRLDGPPQRRRVHRILPHDLP